MWKQKDLIKTHDPRQIDVDQTSSTQEPRGPPLPCGCNLVAHSFNRNQTAAFTNKITPAGQGWPSGHFVWTTLKSLSKMWKDTYRMDPKIVNFRQVVHLPVVDFWSKKVCFWQVACCATSVCFCKTDWSTDFNWSRMPWLCHPKSVSRAAAQWQNGRKSVGSRRRRRTENGHHFLSVAHAKCPAGNW